MSFLNRLATCLLMFGILSFSPIANAHASLEELDDIFLKSSRAQDIIDDVTITSYQDRSTSSQSGFGFDASYTTSTGARGGIQGSTGGGSAREVKEDAGLFIEDTSDLKITNLTVTGKTLDPKLVALAQHIIFNVLKDEHSSWSIQANVANLDLSSPEAFANSLATNAGKVALGAFVAEMTHKLGGRGILPSVVGMTAGVLHENF